LKLTGEGKIYLFALNEEIRSFKELDDSAGNITDFFHLSLALNSELFSDIKRDTV
jgi:hypothetical protein